MNCFTKGAPSRAVSRSNPTAATMPRASIPTTVNREGIRTKLRPGIQYMTRQMPSGGPIDSHQHSTTIDAQGVGKMVPVQAIDVPSGAAPEARELIAQLYDCLDRYDLSSMVRKLENV